MKMCLLSRVAAGILLVASGTTRAADSNAGRQSQRKWTEPSRSR